MLEITIRTHGPDGSKVFQFENDALQAFLADAHATDVGCQVVSLQALGVPLTVTGDMPKRTTPDGRNWRGPQAPGEPRTQAPGINTPIQEQARESGTLRQPTTVDAAWKAADKAKAERDAAAKAAQPPKPEKK